MSMEFVNRICPKCKNPNYMILLGDFSKAYKYKCMNCNSYFNDIDFEKEPLQPVWKSKCMNIKVDMVEVVRFKDCALRFTDKCVLHDQAFPVNKGNNWFCADGGRKDS